MNIVRSIVGAPFSAAVILGLMGCGAALQSGPATNLQGNIDRIQSHVSPDEKDAPRLFFQASLDGTIYILALPQLKLKGTITGLYEPLGMCSDASGNVYVAESGAARVDKLSRAGTFLSEYVDPYGTPSACAVNPKNGDVAVADVAGATRALIFSSPSSPPAVLAISNMTYLDYAAYDRKGELWISGNDGDYLAIARCSASKCRTLVVKNGGDFHTGAVQWDGVRKTWVIFEESCPNNPGSCSFPISKKGVLGNDTSYYRNKNQQVCALQQAVIGALAKSYVVGGDWGTPCYGSGSNAVYRWSYPAGGTPANHYRLPDYAEPYGSALSIK